MGGIARALLSLRGRLKRRQFWLGFLVVFVGAAYSNQDQQTANTIVGLVTLYMALCVYGKRLHDFDKSAWYMTIPLGATFASYVFTAVQVSQASGSNLWQLMETLKLVNLGLLGVWVITTGWIGIYPGHRGDNRFGMDPGEKRSLPTAPPGSAA